ncbi:BA75_02508T0 [Komagataella pastoris]|uniref:BA75_02508T0 n=1 Tax=Komagataella pastoris TaxID=4922 RepID=A0A1B2JAN9_PICPA|nr:BA75_02508T0 [Komagataella pastoris]
MADNYSITSMQDSEKARTPDDDENSLARVVLSQNEEYIFLGRQKFRKSDLYAAFGGTLNPGVTAPPIHKFGNPAPLGLSAFALTTFVLSLINAQAMGVTQTNVVVGLALFYGGLIQLLAGMWEMAVENTFGALALSSYGGFWLSYAVLNIPWFGVASAYEQSRDFQVAVGFYLLGWTIFTSMLCLCTMKSTVAFFLLFFFLAITFLMLTVGELAPSVNCTRAGGVLGVITAFISWYNAYAGLSTPENSYLQVSAVPLPGSVSRGLRSK